MRKLAKKKTRKRYHYDVALKNQYEGSFSLRLLLEMHRLDELVHMFVEPGIVPY
jgi:hypothetical protein